MSDSWHDAEDLGKNRIGFLIADLDMALTFMDVADVSSILKTQQRNHRNARKAYDTIVGLLPKLQPDVEEQAKIALKLAKLKDRLVAVGQKF